MMLERKKAIIAYMSACAVFKKWLADGLISQTDYRIIEDIIAEKYGLSLCSLWHEQT